VTTTLTPDRVLQIGMGFWAAKALQSAVELGVFTRLAKGPMRRGPLAAALNLHARAARDFLDTLVALKLLDRQGELYSNSPEADRFLDKAKPTYVGGILEMASARLYPSWGRLTEALKSGRPQNEAAGQEPTEDHFATIYADPARMRLFAEAMTGISAGAGRALAEKFHWAQHRTFFDIGCAQGAVPVQLALAHKHLSGGGFDLPAVGPVFSEYVRSFGLSDRLRFEGGDLFKSPWPRADVYVLGHMLHGWGLEGKRAILRRAYESLPPGGALIVYDAMIDDERRESAFGLLMSLNMLIETSEGFDYTGADCQGWLREAGFRQTRSEPLAGPESMVVGVK
jgi:hypothetical protein